MRAQAEAQARAQQQQRPRQQPAAPPPPPPQQRPPARLVPARQQEPAYPEIADAEVVDAELADSGERVGRQVARDLSGSAQIAEHTRQLGAEVDKADDKMAAHLHQVFDHQLGNLKKSATDQAAPAASAAKRTGFTAGSIVDMLTSPDSVCNAIILGEILRRPYDRWDG